MHGSCLHCEGIACAGGVLSMPNDIFRLLSNAWTALGPACYRNLLAAPGLKAAQCMWTHNANADAKVECISQLAISKQGHNMLHMQVTLVQLS